METDDLRKKIAKNLFTERVTDDNREKLKSEIFEHYKLYLEFLDKISERREHANSYFLTINTGVCGLLGYLYGKDVAPELHSLIWCLPIAGILLSYFWYRLVKSYRDLNSAKFAVVHAMEEQLLMRPYKAEWIALGEGKDQKKYTPFSHLEIWVPRCLMLMYVIIEINILPWKELQKFIGW